MSQMFHLFQTYVAIVHPDVAKVYLDVAYTCMLQAYVSSILGVSYVCYECFIWMLHTFCNGYKCFNCFGHMLQVFYLDITKVDLGVAHYSCWPACMRVGVEGCHGVGTGHEACTGHGADTGHGVARAST
jgi:hypothetical protein